MEQDKAIEAAWADWTKHVAQRPEGPHVEYTEDDGTKILTRTTSLPFQLKDGTPVILLKDKRGGQALERVRVLETTPSLADGIRALCRDIDTADPFPVAGQPRRSVAWMALADGRYVCSEPCKTKLELRGNE